MVIIAHILVLMPVQPNNMVTLPPNSVSIVPAHAPSAKTKPTVQVASQMLP
jgi:hypothetical protein